LVRPREDPDDTVDVTLAEYVSSFKRYQYTQKWIDLLVDECRTTDGFERVTAGHRPRSNKSAKASRRDAPPSITAEPVSGLHSRFVSIGILRWSATEICDFSH